MALVPITDYDTLLAAVPEVANRNDAEYINAVPLFIQQAEIRLFRHLRCPGNESVAAFLAGSNDNRHGVKIPSDYLECKWLLYGSRPLARISDQRYLEWSHRSVAPAYPAYFARVSGDLLFYPHADVNDDVRVGYYQTQGPLSATNPWTRLLRIAPNAYLFGALAEGARFVRDDREAGQWEQQFQAEIESMNAQAYDNEVAGSTVVVGGAW